MLQFYDLQFSYFRTVIVLFLTHSTLATQIQFRSDYTYDKESNMFMKLSELPANWEEARLRCHMEGATLASPLTDSIKNAMIKIAGARTVHTGIRRTFGTEMHSVEGVPIRKMDLSWAKYQPDNHDNLEDCIELGQNGKVNDYHCSEPNDYICYKEKRPNFNYTLNDCGTTDSEYKKINENGNCYKIHKYPLTWSRAFMTCEAEGGYLAIINSVKEAKELGSLFNNHKWKTQVGEYVKDRMSIGFHDWNEHGEWRTINGESLAEAGYDGFKHGYPKNTTGGQFCGAIVKMDSTNNILADHYCDKRAAFICEKDPKTLTIP